VEYTHNQMKEYQMKFVRMFTGEDGRTHFEELPEPFELSQDAQRTTTENSNGIQFLYQPPGFVIDMHPAPRRQYVITLQGQAEIILGDGTSLIFGAGDALLAEDITGEGHITRIVGDIPRISAQIHL
jgi:quercetin dioxygenase-like cupin family protein